MMAAEMMVGIWSFRKWRIGAVELWSVGVVEWIPLDMQQEQWIETRCITSVNELQILNIE